VSRVSKHFVFRLVPTSVVYSDKVVVFVRNTYHDWYILSSDLHLSWAVEFAGTHGSGTAEYKNYKPTECGRTYPFPRLTHMKEQQLTLLGEKFNVFRESLFRRLQKGPTALYNEVHNRSDKTNDVRSLRDLHVEMDNTVAAAYGWSDLDLGHGFHETRQGIRFTISETARREVLARLLKLNHERYAEEVAQGLHDKKKGKAAKTLRKSKGKASSEPSLFGEEE
jgi:hypothetical protein